MKMLSDEKIELHVIGCGDAFGSGGRLNTCFYIQTPEIGMLLDCGATVLPSLKKQGIRTNQIDFILLTHFHGDHYGGLPYFIMEASVYQRRKKLTIMSPPGAAEKIKTLLDLLYPGADAIEKLNLEFITYNEGECVTTDHFNLTPYKVIHTEAALPHGIRIQIGNKVISYSGDTSWTDNLILLSQNSDLFICECNFYSTRVKGHLCYQELELKIPKLSCKRILLTHLDEEMLRRGKDVKLECATDGMKILI
ncbi:MAG: MBL fold metallo-hydrolase [Chitinophagaceae bacterium]|nr:MAG: MBL fold metallo-hydrolase [Chitinophagaceae bacterium]